MRIAVPTRVRRCKVCRNWVDRALIGEDFCCTGCKHNLDPALSAMEKVRAQLVRDVQAEVKAEVLETLLNDIKCLKRGRRRNWRQRVLALAFSEYLYGPDTSR